MLSMFLGKVIMVQFTRYSLQVHFLQLHNICNELIFPKGNQEFNDSPQVNWYEAWAKRWVETKHKMGNGGFPEIKLQVRYAPAPEPQDGCTVRLLISAVCCIAAGCHTQHEFYGWNLITRRWKMMEFIEMIKRHLLRSLLARFPAFHYLRKIMMC